MTDEIKKKVKSPCFANLTIKEIIVLSVLCLTYLFNVALIYYQVRDLPRKFEKINLSIQKNTEDIINLKTDTSEMKSDIKNIKQNTDMILKHILRKK